METSGAIKIFEQSVITRGLKYTSMLCDSDHLGKSALLISWNVSAIFIRERWMSAERIKECKESDGKGVSGKGRLTDGKIDILQNYYSLALRNNLNVREMAKQIKAALFHVTSTNKKPQH